MTLNREFDKNVGTNFNLQECITLLLVFLGAVNFINRYFYFVYIAFIFVFMYKRLLIPMKISTFALFSVGVCYLIFLSDTTDSVTNMIKPFTYFVSYIIGYNYVRQSEKDSEGTTSQRIIRLIVVVAIGTCVHLVLNMFINQGISESVVERNTVDFWTRKPMAATGQAALGCITIAVCVAMLFSDVHKKTKIVAIFGLLVILYYNLTLAGRTLIIMTLIMLAIALVRLISSSKLSASKKVAILAGATLIIMILVVMYNSNVAGIKSTVMNSNIYERFFGEYNVELDDDKRMEYKIMYLGNMWEHPWGNGQLRKVTGHYAHDLYLDTCSDAGILALLAIAIYVLSSLSRLLKIMKNKNVSFIFKQVIFCVYVIINIEFWLEPVIEGIPWFLASYCLIDGAVSCFISMNREGENERKEVEEGAV